MDPENDLDKPSGNSGGLVARIVLVGVFALVAGLVSYLIRDYKRNYARRVTIPAKAREGLEQKRQREKLEKLESELNQSNQTGEKKDSPDNSSSQ